MAKTYFNNIEEVYSYREERLAFNMVDLYASCPTLSSLLKKEQEGFYRKNKSVPLIREGDVICLVENRTTQLKAYHTANKNVTDVVTFEELMKSSAAIYNADQTREIIPAVKHTLRSGLFSDKPVVPNYFVRAITSIFSTIIEESIGRDHVVDYSSELSDLLQVERIPPAEMKEVALNYIYTQQIKSGKRTAITDEEIDELAEKFDMDYLRVLENIVAEVDSATYKNIRKFVDENPCNRYHFDEDDLFFYVERGLDTRIYAWEKERFEKIEAVEDAIGVKLKETSYPAFSSTYNFL